MGDDRIVEFFEFLNENADIIQRESYPPEGGIKEASPWLMEQIHKFDARVNCEKGERPCLKQLIAKNVTRENAKALMEQIRLLAQNLYIQPQTQRRFLSEVRVGIFDPRFADDPALTEHARDTLRVSMSDDRRLRNQANERRIKTLSTQIEVRADQVQDLIVKHIHSKKLAPRAMALALASGCRTAELFLSSVSDFQVAESGRDHWIVQVGLAKDRERTTRRFLAHKQKLQRQKGEEEEDEEEEDGEEEDPEDIRSTKRLVKPVLFITSTDFLVSIEWLRRHYKRQYPNDQTPVLMNNRMHSRLTAELRRAFGLESITFHRFTRSVYSELSYHLFNTEKGKSQLLWSTQVLGHKQTSVESALNYQNVKLVYQLPKSSPNAVKQSILQLQGQLNQLLTQQRELMKPRDERSEFITQVVDDRTGVAKMVVLPVFKRRRDCKMDESLRHYVEENLMGQGYRVERTTLLEAGFSRACIQRVMMPPRKKRKADN